MRGTPDSIKIPIRNLRFQILESSLGTHAGNSRFYINHFTGRCLIAHHALEIVAPGFVLTRSETRILGVDFEIPERLRKLHCKVNLSSLGPSVGTSPAQ